MHAGDGFRSFRIWRFDAIRIHHGFGIRDLYVLPQFVQHGFVAARDRAEPLGDAAAGTLRVEEIEVTPADLDSARLRRFLEECGFDAGDIDGVVSAATPQVRAHGSAVLRVRLADDRSGVDILPVESTAPSGWTSPRIR